jgi:hypothetical protein
LISNAEAEVILQQVEARGGRRNRAADRIYLLSGLLVSPDGTACSGETYHGAGAYRLGKGPRIAARLLDAAVLDTVFADLCAPATAARIAERMRAQASPPRDADAPERIRRRLATLDAKTDRLVELIAEDAEAAPAYRGAVAKMEGERAAPAAKLRTAEQAADTADVSCRSGPRPTSSACCGACARACNQASTPAGPRPAHGPNRADRSE